MSGESFSHRAHALPSEQERERLAAFLFAFFTTACACQALQHHEEALGDNGGAALATVDLAGHPDALLLQGRTRGAVAKKLVADMKAIYGQTVRPHVASDLDGRTVSLTLQSDLYGRKVKVDTYDGIVARTHTTHPVRGQDLFLHRCSLSLSRLPTRRRRRSCSRPTPRGAPKRTRREA